VISWWLAIDIFPPKNRSSFAAFCAFWHLKSYKIYRINVIFGTDVQYIQKRVVNVMDSFFIDWKTVLINVKS